MRYVGNEDAEYDPRVVVLKRRVSELYQSHLRHRSEAEVPESLEAFGACHFCNAIDEKV